MESRLRRPQFGLKKAISAFNVNYQPNTGTLTKADNVLPSSSSSTCSLNGVAEALKKTKSSQNLNSKPSIENVPPPRQMLRRSKTMTSIARSNVTLRATAKRPGTAIDTVAAKKASLRTAASTLTNQKAAVKKPSAVTTEKKESTKPPKWDMKGRLAYTIEELAVSRESCKEAEVRNASLVTEVEDCRTTELNNRLRAERFELLNADLMTEITNLKKEITNLDTEKQNAMEQRPILEEKIRIRSASLEACREKCKKNERALSDLSTKISMLQNSVDSMAREIEREHQVKDEMQNMIHTLDKEKRQLHNTIQELKGNIRVFCRVRPLLRKESNKGSCSITFPDDCTIEVGRAEAPSYGGRTRGTRYDFNFDKVFPSSATQADIFEELCLLVQSALEGYNVCVFAYGQTGSGKTYTMEGGLGAESEGMIPRTVKHIFAEKKQFELLGWEYCIEASFLEIYNEHIVDLLDSETKTHEIRMTDTKGTDVFVTNLRIETIHSPKELEDCLKTAQRNRAVAATQSNERSSRSHSVTRIRLIGTHSTKGEVCIGNLNLVDLAGSERFRNDEAVRTTETKNINKSLANLGNVILALLKKQDHIPYRNSKLTHLLMPSLGGNSKTLMLLNVSPLDECYSETLNSLRFASNVNSCKTGTVKRVRTVLQNSM